MITHSKKPKRIRPFSKKREGQNKLYRKLAIQFKKDNPLCHACWVAPVAHVHHKKGRTGPLFLDQSFWMPVCFKCHDWIGSHPKEALAKGWNVLRNTK